MKILFAVANDSGMYGIGDVVLIESYETNDYNEIIATDTCGDEFTAYGVYEIKGGKINRVI